MDLLVGLFFVFACLLVFFLLVSDFGSVLCLVKLWRFVGVSWFCLHFLAFSFFGFSVCFRASFLFDMFVFDCFGVLFPLPVFDCGYFIFLFFSC